MHNPVGELTAEHPGVVKIGRAGWFAKGVVYMIAGYLALSVAAKASGWTDSSSGDRRPGGQPDRRDQDGRRFVAAERCCCGCWPSGC